MPSLISTTGDVRFQSRPVADIVQRGFDTRKTLHINDFHIRGIEMPSKYLILRYVSLWLLRLDSNQQLSG